MSNAESTAESMKNEEQQFVTQFGDSCEMHSFTSSLDAVGDPRAFDCTGLSAKHDKIPSEGASAATARVHPGRKAALGFSNSPRSLREPDTEDGRHRSHPSREEFGAFGSFGGFIVRPST